jgi:hypothetical protein
MVFTGEGDTKQIDNKKDDEQEEQEDRWPMREMDNWVARSPAYYGS